VGSVQRAILDQNDVADSKLGGRDRDNSDDIPGLQRRRHAPGQHHELERFSGT
jgi:hypothetical protein